MFITDLLGASQGFRPNVSKVLLSKSLHFSDREGGQETRKCKSECLITTRKKRKAEQSDRGTGLLFRVDEREGRKERLGSGTTCPIW